MARIRKRGKTWSFEIERKGKGEKSYHGSGFRTKKEASDKAKEIELQLASGQLTVYENPLTLVELFDSWLEVEILPQKLDIDTKKRYKRRREVIKNYFGDMLVSDIVRSNYQKFINFYGESYEINELGRMNANITKAVEFAKADRIPIDDSFLKNIKLNSIREPRHPDTKFLHSQDDYERVMKYLRLFMDYRKSVVPYVLYILFGIGLRPGEALSLTWADIDFDRQEVYTHSRWSSHKHTVVPPKNDHYYRRINRRNPSVRKVPANMQVMQVLQELKSIQERTLKVLNLENRENFVFFQYGAKWPVPDESTLNKALKKMLKQLEIEPIMTVYGARHTYGSVKVREGVPLEALAKWFGHKDTTMLREVYVHLLQETDDEWAEIEKGKTLGQTFGQTQKTHKKSLLE